MSERELILKLNEKEAQFLRLAVQLGPNDILRESLVVRLNILCDPERQEQLTREYRELYWNLNDLQLCATEAYDYHEPLEKRMNEICDQLGYTPAG